MKAKMYLGGMPPKNKGMSKAKKQMMRDMKKTGGYEVCDTK